jgi:PAS domain S-box-containing protein
MSGFALIAVFIGVSTLIGLYLVVRQLERSEKPERFNQPFVPTSASQKDTAVIVVSENGQVLHVNELAQRWLQLEADSLDLEIIASRIQPSDNFFQLLSGEAHVSFRIVDHWVSADSHIVPTSNGWQAVLTLREETAVDNANGQKNGMNVSLAMLTINQINETVTARMNIETTLQVLLDIVNQALPSSAGEICLWNDEQQFLEQRGWVGDTMYLLQMAEMGGGYTPGQGLAGMVVQVQKTVLVRGVNDSVNLANVLSKTNYKSAIAIPLTMNSDFMGTLALFNETENAYSERDIAFLEAINKTVATSIFNATLYTQQEHRLNDIARLQELAENPTNRDSGIIYAKLNERIAQLMNADMSGIFLYDPDRNVLIPQLPFFGLNETVANRIHIPLPLRSPQRDIWEHQPYWVSNDLSNEPLVEALGLKPILDVASIHNTALLPMAISGERIGFLAVSNKRDTNGFMPNDIQSLRVLATQAAILVGNLRLFQKERTLDNELMGLQQMTEAIGSLNHEGEFFASITERVARLMQCEMCGILSYHESQRQLLAQLPFFGVRDEILINYHINLPIGSVMDDLWTDDFYWFSNHVKTDTLVFEAGLDTIAEKANVTRTLMAVMAVGGRRIGVVQVSNPTDGRDFSDKDARLLQIFATQAAAIIENARLFREVQVRAEQADGLRRIAELASALMTPDQSFAPVLLEIARFMDSPVVYINTIDHNTNSLITYPNRMYGLDFSEPVLQDLTAPDFKYSVALSGSTFFSNDLMADKRVIPSYRVMSQRYKLASAVLVPLIVGETTLGELGVSNRTSRPYQEADVVALSTVASQISASLERLLLYEATGENLRRRMQELDAIARVSNELALTLELNKVLDTIRQEVKATLGADDATIALLRPSETWRVSTQPEFDSRLGDLHAEKLLPIEREAVLRGSDPLLIADYTTSDIKPEPTNARSAVAISIMYSEKVVGVIHAYSYSSYRFDERSAGFLLTIASKATLGYQNASYFQQQLEQKDSLRQRVDQLNRIFELGQMLQSNADVDSLLEAVAYSVQQSVGYDTVLMLLVDESAGVVRRVAQAGMPLPAFQRSRQDVTSLDTLSDFLKPEFRISESYFFPLEQAKKWAMTGIEALNTTYADNRSVMPRGKDYWHDGDILVINISGQGGNLLGMIVLDRPYNNKRPDRARIEVLEIFAHQAATMIENTRLFVESQRNAEQEAQLNNIMNAVSSTFDLNEIASAIAKGIKSVVPFSRLNLVVANTTQNDTFDYLRILVKPDGDLNVVQEVRTSLDRTALGRTYADRHTHTYKTNDDIIKLYDDLKAWYASGEKSTLIVPLIAGGECLGALQVGSDLPNTMTATDIRPIVERVAQLVASSLQNARLFNQAVNLQVLNRSVVESIQQGIVVLDNSGRIISINEFMREAYGWGDSALRQDLFTYQPELSEALAVELRAVLDDGQPRERLGFTSSDKNKKIIVRNFYIYSLRAGETVRGAVLLVDDVTERTRLEQAIETRANQLAALTEVSTRITSLLERSEIINLAIEEMGWIIPFDSMTIWRRNGSFMVLEGATGFVNNRALLGHRLKISEDERIQTIVESQRGLGLSNPNGLPLLGLPEEDIVRSWLGVPLVSQGHVVGMLMLTRQTVGDYTSREEQYVAFAFASQVAIALANADLFEQTFERTNELGTLLEAAQATTASRNLDDVFRTVAELMFSALEQEDCTIMIWDEVDNELEVAFTLNRGGKSTSNFPKDTRYNLAMYPARARCLQNRDVVVIVDHPGVQNPEEYQYELEELRRIKRGARLLVPLVVSDQSIGLIQLEQTSSEERSLTQQKVRLAKALGSQVAVAIENARLSAETNVRFEELFTINSLSQAISSTLKLDDMLPIIRDQVPSVTKAEEMYLALYDAENQTITFPLAVRQGKTFKMPPRPLGSDEVSYIIKRKRSLSLGADYFSLEDLRASMGIVNGEGEAKSYLGVPLISGDQVLGVLALRNMTKSRAFNLNDDRILTTVGSQLSAAIQNARLFERVSSFADELNQLVKVRTDELEEERDRLDTLYQITSELSQTLDMEDLLNRALGMVSKAVGAEDGVILISDPATDSLYCRASLNPNNLIPRENDRPTHPAVGLAGWFLENADEHDHVILVNDLLEEPYWDKKNASQMRSALAVILEHNEDPMGVMVLLSEEVASFTENHVKLLVPAANQVAASINSADLYQLIREQTDRLAKLLRTEQEDKQKQGAILEGINDGVLLADASGKIVLVNNAAEQILTTPRTQIMNQHVSSLVNIFGEAAFDWMKFVNQLSNSIENKINTVEYSSERIQLNEYFVSIYLTPVYEGDKFLGVLTVLRDITQDVEAERTKDQFITRVSHEFRTPLTPVKGFTDLLLMGAGGQLSESQSAMVETIKQNVERLTILVNDVLNISKLNTKDDVTMLKMVNLSEILQGVLDQIAGRSINVKRGYVSSVQIDNDVPKIRADRDKLLQIINNLIDNAFKYTRPGGRVDVRAKLEAERKTVLISIADSGVGIPDEFKDNIWTRFERYEADVLELDVAGTGLGLALVKELVTLHNGEIWFESERGKGTTFFVRLPIEQPNYATNSISIVQGTEEQER